MNYDQTLSRVETYFDKTALKTWERLTSTAPVSRIRNPFVMAVIKCEIANFQLPKDLSGARVLERDVVPVNLVKNLLCVGAK